LAQVLWLFGITPRQRRGLDLTTFWWAITCWATTQPPRRCTALASACLAITRVASGQPQLHSTTHLSCLAFSPVARPKIGFASGILIVAQRQAALVAKQAASLDELCGRRFRLGVGVGWNEIEFQGLGLDFRTRGRRSEEQVRFMQALWAEPHTTFHGEFHHLDDGGLTLRPKSGRVPVWFGGHAEATFHRVAKYGDGYMQLDYAPGNEALAAFAKLSRPDP
jgi:alkanesulfonate monooxygenase SsuD/methylene tetrahydromethanopterin reductase-like flavin-dependent oxidoreductase (luciferase family)